jgi:hypothetical protein
MRKKYKEPRRDKPQPGSKGKEAPANFHIVASSRILRTKETIVDRSILDHPAWRQHWERQANYFDAVYESAKLTGTHDD